MNSAIIPARSIIDIRDQFPILKQRVGKNPLIYFDNAATSQKPEVVIQAIDSYYREYNANIHRGAHYLADKGTLAYEAARESIAKFIGANENAEVIFTSGTTAGLNMLASGFAQSLLKKGDEILLSDMEHHANIVPWQMACERSGAIIRVIPVTDSGELDLEAADKLISEKTKVLSITQVSNALGTINPVKNLLEKARAAGAVTILDCAQAVAHFRLRVQESGADFIVFSGHKVFGPTGIGILWGRKEMLENLPPFMGGGEMIKEVRFEKTTYNELPFRLEAGTPHIAGGIGLGAAIHWLEAQDEVLLATQEKNLLEKATSIIQSFKGLRIIGSSEHKASVVSFASDKAHPSDIGTLLDQQGIAVRTGHHCCQPLMRRFQVPGTVRVSLAFYNTEEELDAFEKALSRVMNMLG
jgi:cysteine desulfurase/selenocysteine lyase